MINGNDGAVALPPGPVLVTGAGGCIGAWVLRTLAQAGADAVGFDLSNDRRRLALLAGEDVAQAQAWETGDIADSETVPDIVRRRNIASVIHLAALQVPFCRAAPADGARVNVVGTINVFEAVRAAGIRHFAYASSSSAAAMGEDSPWLQTLYGAYKVCNEQAARVYWRDWQVSAVGIRPSVIYGPMRDRGVSSVVTAAMLAAVLGRPYQVPFSGRVGFVYAGEAAHAFIHAAACGGSGAPVFDLNGTEESVERVTALIRERHPRAQVSYTGDPLALPSDFSDEPLRAHVGNYRRWTIEEGVAETLEVFENLAKAGKLSVADLPS